MSLDNAFYFNYEQNGFNFSEYIYYISSYHYNWHPEVEILVVLKGSIEISFDSKNTTLVKDDVVILAPNCGHASLALKEDTKAMVLHIDPNFLTRYMPNFKNYDFTIISNDSSRYNFLFTEIRKRMSQMMLIKIKDNNQFNYIYLELQFMKLCAALLAEITKQGVLKDNKKIVEENNATFNKIVSYIDNHYKEKIDLEDIAQLSGYNFSYTSQFFKRQLGISFVEYLSRLRLREAAIELVNTEALIVNIANDCGYADVKAFNSAFKKHFNKTPSEYRKKYGNIHKPTVIHNWKEYISKNDKECLNFLQNYSYEKAYAVTSYPSCEDDTLLHEVSDTLNMIIDKIKSNNMTK